jgi:hypothetical protein
VPVVLIGSRNEARRTSPRCRRPGGWARTPCWAWETADTPRRTCAANDRYEPDKFGTAGLTEVSGELVDAPRVAQCPIQLECVVDAAYPVGVPESAATAFHVTVVRAHVDEDVLVPGTHYVDPLRWDPLIMKFCEFFGGGENVHPSRLAEGWRMPHAVPAR